MAVSRVRPVGHWLDWPDTTYGVITGAELDALDTDLYNLRSNVANVKDRAYGAAGDGVANDYTAIMAAYTAIPSTGGDLVLPPGTYNCGTALAFTDAKPVRIIGSGATIRFTFASGDAITINGPTVVGVHDLTLSSSVTRSASSYYLKIVGASTCHVSNVVAFASAPGSGMYLSGCNSARVSDCRFAATDGTQLRLAACSGTSVTSSFFSQGASEGSAPTAYVTGTSTSLTFTGCHFGGGGPTTNVAVSGIASDASKFTVTTATPHGLQVNDFACVRGASVSTYNSQWRIATVPTSTSLTVASTANPGAASGGTAESVAACFYVDNSAGSCNESMIANCIFETGGGPAYGTASAVFNGRAVTDGTGNSSINGWTVTGCYMDYGQTGVLLASQDANPSHQSTVYGFSIGDCVFATKARAIHLDRPQGVTVDNCNLNWPSTYTADGVSATCGLYVWAGPSPKAQATGITVRGCNLGWPRDFGLFSETLATYGVILDGAGINDLLIQGNQIGGSTAAVGMINTPVAAAQRWTITGNSLVSGSLPVVNTTFLPSVASALTVDLTPLVHETVKITGTTNIQTISGGWVGRRTTLIFPDGDLWISNGGNISVPSEGKYVRQGEAIIFTFDGTSWYSTSNTLPTIEQTALSAYGLKSWTANPTGLNQSTTASQTIVLTAIALRAGDLVTNLFASVLTAAAGTTPTTIKLGLYNTAGTRLAVTANLASDSKWTSLGFKSFAVSSPFLVTVTGMYYVAFLKDGVFGTTDLVIGAAAGNQVVGSLNSLFPHGFGGTGQTDLGASITPASGGGSATWFGVS